MKKKVILGLVLSALLVYLSVRGIQFQGVMEAIKAVRSAYLFPALFMLLLMQVFRSFRWGLILRPIARLEPLPLFSVTSVGFLAIIAIPARLGELARPYLIRQRCGVPMSSALGTVFVERVFDCLTVLMIAALAVFFTELPPWLIRSSVLLLVITMGVFVCMVLLIVKREASLAVLKPLIGKLPPRYGTAVHRLIHHFIQGFGMVVDPALLASVAGLSLLTWLVYVLSIYMTFLAFGFHLPFSASVVLMIILIIGIAIPTAPGFVGSWHYACILGLGLFGIPKTEALSFAILFHFLSIGIVIALGLIFLPFNRFSLSDIRQETTP